MEKTLQPLKIESLIYEIRGHKVMLDRDLAKLYGVTTGNLNKAVKRNIERFPERYMFQLNSEEYLKFQNGISSWGGTRSLPYAFTEQGVAMSFPYFNVIILFVVLSLESYFWTWGVAGGFFN